MKTIKNIFGLLLTCMILTTVWSCDDEVEYSPAEALTSAQVYFPSGLSSTVDLAEDGTSFSIEVYRVVTEGAASYSLTVNDGSGKLKVPASVDFASGASTTTLTIGYNPEDFEYEVYNDVEIAFADASVTTPYGVSSYSFSVGRPAPWTDWELFGTGTYTFTQYYSGTHDGRECYVRTYKLDENIKQFRLDDLAGAYSYVVDYDASTGKCLVQPQHIFDHSSYGPLYVASTHTYWMDVRGDATATEEAVGASTFNPETGLFSLNVAYYVSAGYFGYGYEYFQLDGFTQPDYTFELAEAGHWVSPEGVDNVVFHLMTGADVASYKYLAATGALKSAAIEATVNGIVDGSVEAAEGEGTGYLAFALPEAGEYTVVAVGFDAAGEAVAYDYISFEYLPVGQDDPWKSLGMCTYTDDVVMPLYTEAGDVCTYQVEIQERTDKPGLFRLVNPYGSAFPFYQYAEAYPEKDVYVEIDAQDPTAVTIEYQSVGLDLGDGELGIYAMASYYMDGGYSKEEVAAAGLFGTYADGVITFPVKGLTCVLGGKLYYANQHGEFKVDMTNMTDAASTRSVFAPAMSKNFGSSFATAPVKEIKTTTVDVKDFTKQRQSTVK